jgi:hypothetical protein
MTDPVLPDPTRFEQGTADRVPDGSTVARRRKGNITAVGILTGLILLGLAIILGLALTRWIRTPWQVFPPNTSPAGEHLTYGVELVVSAFLGIPIAVLVIIMGHVALYVLRRIPRYRPDYAEPSRILTTLVLVVALATAYLALAMQVYYLVTYNPNY